MGTGLIVDMIWPKNYLKLISTTINLVALKFNDKFSFL